MNHQLTPSLLSYNGQLIETYSRQSKANNEVKQDLGLPTDEPVNANIGLSSIEEYIILQNQDLIPKNGSVTWRLDSIGQPVKIESIFIDSPQADRFTFELLLGNQVIFTLTLSRNKTPYDLPDAPLSDDVSIRITARDVINLVRIVCKPVAILETIYSVDSEEDEDEA